MNQSLGMEEGSSSSTPLHSAYSRGSSRLSQGTSRCDGAELHVIFDEKGDSSHMGGCEEQGWR